MALTGSTVASTYLDLVQLEQSGSGLPSHAGKEAALYDGSGAQVVGRTAIRHPLDPEPDAVATSFEFGTMGDKNQAALVTDGWTFTGCTGKVENGFLVLESSGTSKAIAEFTVSLTGDFEYVLMMGNLPIATATSYGKQGFGVADTVNDIVHMVQMSASVDGQKAYTRYGITFSTMAGGTSATVAASGIINRLYRISRTSGTVYFSSSGWFSGCAIGTAVPRANEGWAAQSVADADTYQKIVLSLDDTNSPTAAGNALYVPFIRRYA